MLNTKASDTAPFGQFGLIDATADNVKTSALDNFKHFNEICVFIELKIIIARDKVLSGQLG